MRQKKTILKKINRWHKHPLLITGLYRLFTYIPYEEIPEMHRQFFNEEAKEIWNTDLKDYTEAKILDGIDTQIKDLLRSFSERAYVQTIGMIPVVLADVFVYGQSIDKLLLETLSLSEEYASWTAVDRDLAEHYTMLGIAEILKEIVKKVNLKLNYNIDEIVNRFVTHFDKLRGQTLASVPENATQDDFNPFNVEIASIAEEKIIDAK